jgi:DNA phosphorothioation-dependent restriction protein DptG
MPIGSKWHRSSPQRIFHLCRHAKISEQVSAPRFSWSRVSKLTSYCWTSGKPVRSQATPVFLSAGARSGLVADLRQTYIDLLRHGIRFDIKLLQGSLAHLGLPKL